MIGAARESLPLHLVCVWKILIAFPVLCCSNQILVWFTFGGGLGLAPSQSGIRKRGSLFFVLFYLLWFVYVWGVSSKFDKTL